jgi:hypothetical protein
VAADVRRAGEDLRPTGRVGRARSVGGATRHEDSPIGESEEAWGGGGERCEQAWRRAADGE